MAVRGHRPIAAVRWIGLALVFMTFAWAPICAAAESGAMDLVDDRGKAIAGELEVCFQAGIRSDCVSGRKARVQVPREFFSVRVEGPDHGPVSVRRQDLKRGPSGDPILVVPRKALLQIGGGPGERLSV